MGVRGGVGGGGRLRHVFLGGDKIWSGVIIVLEFAGEGGRKGGRKEGRKEGIDYGIIEWNRIVWFFVFCSCT